MNIEKLLDKQIEKLFEKLDTLPADSKEYAAVEEAVTKLMNEKNKLMELEMTATHNEKQLKEERKTRIINVIVDVIGILLPLGVTIWGTLLAFTFEENGTITSSIGRKFMDKLISKK